MIRDNISFVSEILSNTENNSNLILNHPLIYDLVKGTLDTNKFINILICDNKLKLAFSVILLNIFNNINFKKTVHKKFFLNLAKSIVTSHSRIKPVLSKYLTNLNSSNKANLFTKPRIEGMSEEYNEYLLNLCSKSSDASMLATVMCIFHIHYEIAIKIKNNLNNLNSYRPELKEIIEYRVLNLTNIQNLNIINLTCNEFAFLASLEEKEEMYQTFRKNLLYHWLILNEVYHKA